MIHSPTSYVNELSEFYTSVETTLTRLGEPHQIVSPSEQHLRDAFDLVCFAARAAAAFTTDTEVIDQVYASAKLAAVQQRLDVLARLVDCAAPTIHQSTQGAN